MSLVSCDTFVVLPPLTGTNGVIFGKNSDRPQGEVQELIYETPKTYQSGTKLMCTYIEIDQVEQTYGVILSKPAWMWGAEMGSNDQGVAIGNEAVWTKVQSEHDLKERLLGMDLVRLGLERSKSAEEAVDVITDLLTKHGQGGPCSDTMTQFSYHNSFLIADPREAWVLETAGKQWAAERISQGFRNVSNELSIETKIDKHSDKLMDYAKENGYWDGEGEFNFAAVYCQGGRNKQRYICGKQLLHDYSRDNNFNVKNMFDVLRNTESDICRGCDDEFPTVASQVSVLSQDKPSCHWFTATPDPNLSVFKPFVFTPNVKISSYTKSPTFDDDPAKVVPRFAKSVDRSHTLYKLHSAAVNSNNYKVLQLLREMETDCLQDVEKFLREFTNGQSLAEVDELLKDVVETEVKFYK